MKQRTAIRIRQARKPWWARRFPRDPDAPTCPTCGSSPGWGRVGVHVRHGHRFLVKVATEWRGLNYGRHGGHRNVPLSKPIRLNWPVKVHKGSGRPGRPTMGRTYVRCPDPFHQSDAALGRRQPEPEPVVSPQIRRLMRFDAPTRHKAKAREHKNRQARNRR